MKTASKVCLIVLSIILAISVSIYISIWRDDAVARKNKSQISNLIKVGHNLHQAEIILKDAGFRLMYDQPITPTINKDYLQQIVIIGKPQPNAFESFAYAAQLSWMPFIHSESPYLVINATTEGAITEIR